MRRICRHAHIYSNTKQFSAIQHYVPDGSDICCVSGLLFTGNAGGLNAFHKEVLQKSVNNHKRRYYHYSRRHLIALVQAVRYITVCGAEHTAEFSVKCFQLKRQSLKIRAYQQAAM